MPILKNYTT